VFDTPALGQTELKDLTKCYGDKIEGLISQIFLCSTAFTSADPNGAKRQSSHHCLFALLISLHKKAANETLTICNRDIIAHFRD